MTRNIELAKANRMPEDWSPDAPKEEGSYWFYGEDSYGSMGGHFTDSIPPRLELHYVKVSAISNGLIAVTNGRFMPMRPFNLNNRKEGYLGMWQRAILPSLPLHLTAEQLLKQHAPIQVQER